MNSIIISFNLFKMNKTQSLPKKAAILLLSGLTVSLFIPSSSLAQDPKPSEKPGQTVVPLIIDGEAQVVPEFEDPENWIVHDLWVETEFDTDGDGKKDRMHVDVTRPRQTDTEGLKLPVVYESSPYFAGTGNGRQHLWNVRQELQTTPSERTHVPEIVARGERPVISRSQVNQWVPRGFIVVHSSSPGTGLSQGCPTVGGDNESLAPKAVIDWLNGRATGYTTPYGNEKVEAYWTTGKVGMTGTSYNGTLPLAAGQQIGLMIFSTDRDFTLWPDPGTELTIDLDATSINMPVVGGLDAFARAIK